MKTKMSFSKHCNYCVGNKAIHDANGVPNLLRLLKEARGYIDGGEYPGNEVQSSDRN